MKLLKQTPIALAAQYALTNDISYTYRMGTGFPGDVNRTHPASIEPSAMNVANPPKAYGQACMVNTATNDVRGMAAGDTAVTTIWGVLARPFPFQQTSGGMNAVIGAAAPPATGIQDFLREGYVMVKVPAGSAATTKKGAVFVWVAADSGAHIQGGFETAASGGNTAAIVNCWFNGPVGTDNVTELQIAVAN